MFMCPYASPVNLLSEFYLPFPFSLLSFCFHHFESEASRGYPMSVGVIKRHHFLSSSGKSSSPPFRDNSSSIYYHKSNVIYPHSFYHPSTCPSYYYLFSIHPFLSVSSHKFTIPRRFPLRLTAHHYLLPSFVSFKICPTYSRLPSLLNYSSFSDL